MATATKNPPKSEPAPSLTATLAAERRAMREQARLDIIRATLAGEAVPHDVRDVLDTLGLRGPDADRFIGESTRIAALQKQAGSVADRKAAHRRLAEAEAARDDGKTGVEALQREIAALNARLVGLERAAVQAQAEVDRREAAVRDLVAVAESDEHAAREYRAAVARVSVPGVQDRQRVRMLEALVAENNIEARKHHAEALLKHERDDLREWGGRLIERYKDGAYIGTRFRNDLWGGYIAERERELSELRPKVERAEKEHAAAIAALRSGLLAAFVPV